MALGVAVVLEAAVGGEAGAAGVAVADSAVAEECRAVEAPADHGNDASTAVEVH